MQTRAKFGAIVAVIMFSVTLVLADEPSQHVTSVDERVNEVDLNILIELYRKASTQLSELRFQMDLSKAEGVTLSDKERGLPDRRIDFLMQQSDRFQDEIRRLREQIVETVEQAQKNL
jgi:hypothetical protein